MKAWLVRAGKNGERESWALENNVVGLGFPEISDMSKISSRDEVATMTGERLPEASIGAVRQYASQLWSFKERISVGDLVVLPSKPAATIAIGKVTSDYYYSASEPDPSKRHCRDVVWLVQDVPRTAIKQDLLYSMGAFSTVCELQRNEAAERVEVLAGSGKDPGQSVASVGVATTEVVDDVADELAPDIVEFASDALRTRMSETFDGDGFEYLVAAILETQGFTCDVSPKGADKGVDITAGSGPLGLSEPRVVVQVKSSPYQVPQEEVLKLQAAISNQQASHGLFVAWGGLNKAARQHLAGHKLAIRVWDAEELIEQFLTAYPALPADIRARIPLRQVWVVVDEAG